MCDGCLVEVVVHVLVTNTSFQVRTVVNYLYSCYTWSGVDPF